MKATLVLCLVAYVVAEAPSEPSAPSMPMVPFMPMNPFMPMAPMAPNLGMFAPMMMMMGGSRRGMRMGSGGVAGPGYGMFQGPPPDMDDGSDEGQIKKAAYMSGLTNSMG